MVVGRRELSVILLAVIAIVFYLVLLSTTPTTAQTGGDTTSQNDEGCDNPQLVDTFSGSNSQITSPFEITGDTFRLTLDAQPVQQGEFASIFIDSVEEDTDLTVPFGNIDVNPVEGQVTETANVLEGPGTFQLNIEADNTQYEVTVEDCVGTEPTNGITVDDEITVQDDEDLQEDVIIEEPTTQRQPRNGQSQDKPIVNIPNKPLPPTGGLPVYGTVAGFILLGAGLLGLGVGIRRGQRR